MKTPGRFLIVRPYIASFIHHRYTRPPLREVLRWLFQPGKEGRARQFVQHVTEEGDFLRIEFRNFTRPFFYPRHARWLDLCQTIDECMNVRNWHNFITDNTQLDSNDVVVDCGSAEGLFSYVASTTAAKVYSVEPIPFWHPSLEKTFADIDNVEIIKSALGHKIETAKMSNDEILSRLGPHGTIQVQIDTLDNLFSGKGVSFLKADLEGHEFCMLLGAEHIIRQNRPKMALTVYHDGNDVQEIVNFLRQIHPTYKFTTRGIASNGNPVLLTAI